MSSNENDLIHVIMYGNKMSHISTLCDARDFYMF